MQRQNCTVKWNKTVDMKAFGCIAEIELMRVKKMKPKTIPMIRLTEKEYQILQTKKMMLQAKSITATVKKCLFEADYLKDFTSLLVEINQRAIRIQRQNYITLKLCEGMLAELSKLGRFPEKVPEINQGIIDRYFEAAKKEAEELYK